jgi:hypothetical protein
MPWPLPVQRAMHCNAMAVRRPEENQI